MSHVDIQRHLDSIVGKAGKERESLDIRLAIERYPELSGFKHPTGEIILCSSEINEYCTDVQLQRYGTEYIALPYLEDMGIRLYSNPVVFYLGLDNDKGFGIVPFSDWEQHFVENEIPKEIITKVKNFLGSHMPASYL